MPEHVEQVAQSIEHVYAAALVELAEQAGDLASVAQEVTDLLALFEQQPDVMRLISSRVLGDSERASSIERIFKGNVSDVLYRFMQVVNAKDRADLMSEIFLAVGQIVDAKSGKVQGEVWTAKELDNLQLAGMASKLGDALGRTVVLTQHVDEKLIGGMKLRIGDQLIDASVLSQLKQMKEKIIAEGRAKTREHLAGIVTEEG